MTKVALDSARLNTPSADVRFFGHPLGLANLFGVEMWERFSFYGMQGILLIYLYYSAARGGLGISQDTATSIVGAYGGLVFICAIVGGWTADRLLGAERTLFYSAVLIMCGHVALSLVPGLPGVGVGLCCIAVGSGGLKATAASIVGDLYDERDPRRDAGFSLFYLGVNIGAFSGPLLTGLVQSSMGFHYGFGLAAIGMALGLMQYALFRKNLRGVGERASNPLPSSLRRRWALAGGVGLGLVALLVLLRVITAANLSDVTVGIAIAAAVGYFSVILLSHRVSRVERLRVVAFIPLFIASAAFWSLFQQIFTVLTIYSDERLNRDLFGWTVPVSWVQSIEPVWVIALAGLFATLWTKLGRRQPSTPMKIALGTIGMGLAFLLFILMKQGPNQAPILGLVLIMGAFAVAELLVSPVGLSLATKLAPKAFHTQLISLYFLSVALGTALSGSLADYYHESNERPYLLWLGLIAVAIGAALMLAVPRIRRLMGGVH